MIKRKKPQISKELIDRTDITAAAQDEDVELNSCRIHGAGAEDGCFDGFTASGCVFDSCKFVGCDFTGASFVDCVFENCDFSNCIFRHSYFSRCALSSCKCMGTELSESVLQHVLVKDCNLQYAGFALSKLTVFEIERSDLTRADLSECRLSGFTATGGVFVRTNFWNTPLKGVDFSGSELAGITVSEAYRELQGAVVDRFQAADLARLLGVTVKD